MGKNISLLKPVVKNIYLKNRVSEKVTYIDVPADVGLEELRSDVKLGAVQMKELDKLVEKKKEPKFIVLTAENEEQGYMAVSYLAACFAQKHSAWKDDSPMDDEDDDDGLYDWSDYEFGDEDEPEDPFEHDAWVEDAYRIPVIDSFALQQFAGVNDPVSPFQQGNFVAGMTGQVSGHRPFWFDCRTHSVCILLREHFSPFGGYSNSNSVIEAMERFRENDKVYILSIKEEVNSFGGWDMDEFEQPEDDEEKMVAVDPLKTQVVLCFTADEAQVRFSSKKAAKRYFVAVFRSWFEKYGMTAKKGFRFEAVINVILAMTEDKVCDMIERVIQYAVRDAEATKGLVLSNEDFAFMDRFVRASGKVKDKESSAKVRLEQELVGMEKVKEQIWDAVKVMKFNRARLKAGIKGSQFHNVHMMLGAPGTAKTTAAKLMGQIMVEEKLLRDNRLAYVNGAELKGMYVGHTAPKVKALFERNDIIIIDEAYSLISQDGRDDAYSGEALAQLATELENHGNDRLVIFAGYGGKDVSEKDNRMKQFLDANPGIKSRINSTFYFESYTGEMMVDIFKRIAANAAYQVEDGADGELLAYFEQRRKDRNFGNGREARSLVEASVKELSARVMAQKSETKLTKSDFALIRAEDVRAAIAKTRFANETQIGQERKQVGFKK